MLIPSIRGVLHDGRTIELDTPLAIPDGVVNVTVQPVDTSTKLPPGEGLRRSFGAWADDAEELDKYLEWNRQQRKQSRPEVDA